MLLPKLEALRERLAETPERLALIARLAQQSGMIWNVSLAGGLELVRALASGAQNPSLIYRLHGKNLPDRPALVHRSGALTFGELDARIDRVALALTRLGVGRGKSFLVMLRNRPEVVILSTTAARMGAAAVPISWRSTARELAYLANHSGASALFVEADLLGVAQDARSSFDSRELANNVFVVGAEGAVDGEGARSFEGLLQGEGGRYSGRPGTEDDASVVIYTSGTTGKPKGAVRKFPKDAFPAAIRFLLETPLQQSDVHLVACPLYHSTAFGFLSLSHILGSTAVILDEFKPELFLAAVSEHRISTAAVVPTMLHRVLALPEEVRRRYDTRSLRAVFSGGAPLSGTLALAFMDVFGDVLHNFYGATETGLVTLARPEDLRAAPGTIGRAVPGNQVRLLGEDGKPVGRGEVGELYVKNQMLIAGYHHDEAATRSSMVDGFFSVGDLARVDPEGRYFIEGRKRDMIISGGVNVYPVELEDVLASHPGIEEAAVVGVPDAEWGERVRAFVVRRSGSTLEEAELKAWLRACLAGPKLPREIVFIDALPRNPTGKVLKRELSRA